MTDANHNVTTWGLDEQGRVTSKTYADGSQITYTYEPNTSRLSTMTDAITNQANLIDDASNVTAVYAYNADNTLASTTYTPSGSEAATPNVSKRPTRCLIDNRFPVDRLEP